MAGRGQTTLDFAVGISLFLGVVVFIFLFVPGILEPFTVGAQEETVTVNRVADGLVQGQLGSPERPNVLRTDCTLAVFSAWDDADRVDRCGVSGQTLQEFVGVEESQPMNVSVYGNTSHTDTGSDLLCWDGELVERDDAASCPVKLAAGGRAPDANADAVTAKRVAYLAGEDVTIRVEMW